MRVLVHASVVQFERGAERQQTDMFIERSPSVVVAVAPRLRAVIAADRAILKKFGETMSRALVAFMRGAEPAPIISTVKASLSGLGAYSSLPRLFNMSSTTIRR